MKTPPSKDDFAKLLMDRIHQTGEKGKIVYDPEEFCLRGEGDRFASIFLTNPYKEYCAANVDSRERVVKCYVRNWFGAAKGMPEEFADGKPDLLPVVRCRSQFELANLQFVGGIWPYQILGEHFGVAIGYDLPESMLLIQQTNLDGWGVNFYEALEAAMENLLMLEAKFIELGEGVYLSATGDNYDASRLLIKNVIRAFHVKGDHIAMIPNRENLIVVGSEDVKGLAGMAKLAEKAMNEPYPISGIALRLDGDEWTPWMPPSSHPSYEDFRHLYIQSFGQDYVEQKTLLDKLHKKKGEDTYVASFSANQSPDGSVYSLAVWMEGTDTLLPKTDRVGLIRLGKKPVIVAWEKVVDMMEPLDIYPSRYRVRGFPSEKQLKAMGNMLK